MLPTRLAFVDLETTGANPVRDRVTEVGIITVNEDGVTRWSSLVDPGCRIPPQIQTLTGISDAMVSGAPRFAELADELTARLDDHVFVAHNARFDYGFLKNEFKRLGQAFRADVVCTVKLSRHLFPQHPRHNLDSLIARHGLQVQDRHRALGDAELIWQFWQQVCASEGEARVAEAVSKQFKRPSVPPHLDPDILDELPDSPGVYLFYGEQGELLYVGKSVNLRQRVLSHFSADTREYRELRLGQQAHRIDWQVTAGELGALLLESRLVKQRQPIHNRQLRRASELCTWQLVEDDGGLLRPALVSGGDIDLTQPHGVYGLFNGKREATKALHSIASAHQLCLVTLGLEKPTARGKPCFGYQLRQCRGACIGAEAPVSHSLRVLGALAGLKLQAWPYPGPIGIVEGDAASDGQEIHLVDAWCYLGTARDEAELAELLAHPPRPVFDRDTYRLLSRHLARQPRVITLVRRGD